MMAARVHVDTFIRSTAASYLPPDVRTFVRDYEFQVPIRSTHLAFAHHFVEHFSRFDRRMRALESFDVTLTFCFTPEHQGCARTTRARRATCTP
jgi:hypothetical protein